MALWLNEWTVYVLFVWSFTNEIQKSNSKHNNLRLFWGKPKKIRTLIYVKKKNLPSFVFTISLSLCLPFFLCLSFFLPLSLAPSVCLYLPSISLPLSQLFSPPLSLSFYRSPAVSPCFYHFFHSLSFLFSPSQLALSLHLSPLSLSLSLPSPSLSPLALSLSLCLTPYLCVSYLFKMDINIVRSPTK